MISQHFRLSSELTGAIAKRLPRAKNQVSAVDSFFQDIYIYMYTLIRGSSNKFLESLLSSNLLDTNIFYFYKRASLACAARLADTVSAGGSLRSPGGDIG